jgi:hypothetical protein
MRHGHGKAGRANLAKILVTYMAGSADLTGPPAPEHWVKTPLGIVNLLPIDMINRQEGGRLPESCPLCGGRKTREFLPGVESLLHFLTIDRRRQEVTSGPEVLRDGAIGCQKALGVPG